MGTENTTRKANNAKSPKDYTDKYLRDKFFTMHRYGLLMSPEFIAEVKKRMPELFKIADALPGTRRLPLPRLRNSGILSEYTRCIQNNRPIYDELHNEMIKRFPDRYDPENRVMRPKQPKTDIKQSASVRYISNGSLLRMYRYAKEKGNPIPQNWIDELLRRYPDIDLATGRISKRTPVAAPLCPISRIYHPYMPSNRTYKITLREIGEPTDGIQYKNVFINRKLLVANALDVKTLMNGSVIAIQCIDNTDTKYWHLVDAKMQPIGHRFGPHVQFAHINDTPDALYLETTMRAIITIKNKHINTPKQFVINCR